MMYFLRETSREFGRLSGAINQTYGGRYYKTSIEDDHYFMNAYKYVYRNPVRARIGKFCEEYPFSTLSGLCGKTRLLIPIVNDALLLGSDFDQQILNWINRTPDPDDEKEIKRALMRPKFEFKITRRERRFPDLDKRLY